MASIAKFDQWQNSAGATYGAVINVVQKHLTAVYSQGMTALTNNQLTDFNASITPTSTNSRILIMMRWFGEFSGEDPQYNSMWGFTRNGTSVGGADTSISGIRNIGMQNSWRSYNGSDSASTPEGISYFYIDSPATTSTLTYSVFWRPESGGHTLYTNRTAADTNGTGYERGTSTLILMEIQ